jgi:uncharacterized protein YcbX
MNPIVTGLFVYPIKSCKGILLNSLDITSRGPKWDRNWVLIDSEGKFISQRTFPSLSQIEVGIDNGVLRFGNSKFGYFQINCEAQESTLKHQFKIWEKECFGEEADLRASEWFSNFLGTKCKLITSLGSNFGSFSRMSSDKRKHRAPLVYADGYPLLIISEESLIFLNEQFIKFNLPTVTMDRFRPNIVVRGLEAHGEDTLGDFAIGNLKMSAIKDCARCAIVNVDPKNGRSSPSTLKMLSNYRKKDGGILFGQNVVQLEEGQIHIGDQLIY